MQLIEFHKKNDLCWYISIKKGRINSSSNKTPEQQETLCLTF